MSSFHYEVWYIHITRKPQFSCASLLPFPHLGLVKVKLGFQYSVDLDAGLKLACQRHDFLWDVLQCDRLVKVWYENKKSQMLRGSGYEDEDDLDEQLDYSFCYIAHPAPVIDFSWRRISKYMPR